MLIQQYSAKRIKRRHSHLNHNQTTCWSLFAVDVTVPCFLPYNCIDNVPIFWPLIENGFQLCIFFPLFSVHISFPCSFFFFVLCVNTCIVLNSSICFYIPRQAANGLVVVCAVCMIETKVTHNCFGQLYLCTA